MHNLKLTLSYEGTAYRGWQKTPTGPSIEAALQRAIEQILQHPVSLQAASRTDAGVHAHGQVVNFLTSKVEINPGRLRASLNALLPKDISVLNVEFMPLSFHPTLDCRGKEYRYYLCTGPVQLPQHRLYSWHVPYPLKLDLIECALPHLTGYRDFSAFCNSKKNARYTDYRREVRLLECIQLEGGRLCFRVDGNHFLYKMVRNLVGTLVAVGKGGIPLETLPNAVQSGHRPATGATAPAHGLFLHHVFYKECCSHAQISPCPSCLSGSCTE